MGLGTKRFVRCERCTIQQTRGDILNFELTLELSNVCEIRSILGTRPHSVPTTIILYTADDAPVVQQLGQPQREHTTDSTGTATAHERGCWCVCAAVPEINTCNFPY